LHCSRLVVPCVGISRVANLAFPVVVPQIWNYLPSCITSS